MSSFKKTFTKQYKDTTGPEQTEDALYWKKFEFPITVKEFTAINHIDVSPTRPCYIAVTTGGKVDVYHQQTTQVWRSLARFQRSAYGGKFRKDGQLMLVGTEEGQLKLFKHKQKQLLRVFKGHNAPAHRVDFVEGTQQIVSFSDDQTAVVWDVTDESKVCTLRGHNDFIRAGIASPASENIVLSGSYDHTVKLWDKRTGSSILTVDHGAPVESVLCYSSGNVFISAGGTEVKIWDAIGGRLLSKLSQHHKTITCLAFAQNHTRLLSGSLDRHIKVYDVNTYSVVHTLDFPAPILTMALAQEDAMLAVGMISDGAGLVSLQHRRKAAQSEMLSKSSQKNATNFRNRVFDDTRVIQDAQIVFRLEKQKLSHYDNHLRKFEYSSALDKVLMANITNKHPNVTVIVLQELIRRQGLRAALAGRNTKSLGFLINFIIRNVGNPSYRQVLVDVANILIDVYSDSLLENPGLVNLFKKLQAEVSYDMQNTRESISLMGAIEMFLVSSQPERASTSFFTDLPEAEMEEESRSNLNPLSGAKVMDVVNVK